MFDGQAELQKINLKCSLGTEFLTQSDFVLELGSFGKMAEGKITFYYYLLELYILFLLWMFGLFVLPAFP